MMSKENRSEMKLEPKDIKIRYFLWQEFRMLRLDLAKQPAHLREQIMEYEENITFMLMDSGYFKNFHFTEKENLKDEASE